eukprot:8387975-Prorocentrum_lima.AAC.1
MWSTASVSDRVLLQNAFCMMFKEMGKSDRLTRAMWGKGYKTHLWQGAHVKAGRPKTYAAKAEKLHG